MKKTEQRFGMTNLPVVAACALLIGVCAWLINRNARVDTLPDILTQIKEQTPKSFNDIIVEEQKWTAQRTTNTPQQVEGYDFKLSPQSSSTLTFAPTDVTLDDASNQDKKHGSAWSVDGEESPLYRSIETIFKQNKFSVSKEGTNTVFSRDSDTCLFSEDQLSCYNPEILAALAAESELFVDAYLATHRDARASDLVFGPVVIKSQDGRGVISSTHAAGYDIAEAVVETQGSKKIALYYQDTEGLWHFVTEANDEFGFTCEAMKVNDEVRKVFYDQVCLTDNGQVKLDTNNRATQ